MSRFVLRKPRTSLQEVTFTREAALLIPEALRHVAVQVFEDEHDERHHLRDAARAVEESLKTSTGRTLVVGLSDEEIAHATAALGHVAHELFRDEPKGDLLYAASKAIGAPAPAAGPRR